MIRFITAEKKNTSQFHVTVNIISSSTDVFVSLSKMFLGEALSA